MKQIKKIELAQDYESAALRASFISNQIAEKLKFDQEVLTIENTIHQRKEEVVTSTKSDFGSFSLLGDLFSVSASRSYDTTKILLTNPYEVERFALVNERDFKKLQSKLKKYMKKNSEEIFYAKIFAAKALQLASMMSVENISSVYSSVTRGALRVSKINFLGVQKITNCTTVNYQERKDGESLSLNSFLLSFNLSSETKHNAYSETSCDLAYNDITVNVEEFLLYDLMVADQILEQQGKILSLKMLNTKAPLYPTWGW